MPEGENGQIGSGPTGSEDRTPGLESGPKAPAPETSAAGEAQGPDEGTSRENFRRMEEKVWSDRKVAGKSKAIEAARQMGLAPEHIEALRADRNDYASRRSEAILSAFEMADLYIANALQDTQRIVELPNKRGSSGEATNADIWEAVRDRLYESPVMAVEEGSGEAQDSAGTPKIPGLTAKIAKIENTGGPGAAAKEVLTIQWQPHESKYKKAGS